MKIIELNLAESIEYFDMARDCVERGMVENTPEAKSIEKMILELTDNLRSESPRVKISIEVL